jgi:hypothetical protein
MKRSENRVNLAGRLVDGTSRWRWDVVLLLSILVVSWPLLLERGLMVSSDYPGWAAIITMLDEEVLPQCHWFWGVPFPRVNAGEILGQPYSLSIVLPWLLAKITSPEWALKLPILFAYLMLGFGFYCYVAPKSSRFAAFLGAHLCVLENLWHVNHGMWYNSFSIGLAFLFFVVIERFAREHRARHWISAVLLLALTIYAHPLGTVMALAGWFGLLVRQLTGKHRPKPVTILLFLSVPVFAIGMALPQVLATVIGSPVGGSISAASQCNPFTLLTTPLSRMVLIVSLYGLGWALRGRRSTLWVILPPLFASLVLYRGWPSLIPFDFPLKKGLAGFADRFLLVGSATTLVLFALGVARLMAALRLARKPWYRTLSGVTGMILWLVLPGIAVLGLSRTFIYQPRTLVSENALVDHGDFVALCDWLETNVDHERERIYIEDTYGRKLDFPLYPANRVGRFSVKALSGRPMHLTHYLSLIALRTGCHQVNGFAVYQNPFSERYCCNGRRLFGTELKDLTPKIMRLRLWALNCRHIVAFSDAMRQFLASLDFLKCSCRFGRFCVFTWRDMPPHFAWFDGSEPTVVPATRVSNIRYEVDLDDVPATDIYISLQYHANWRAYIGSDPLAIEPWNGLVAVRLPTGSRGKLRLVYEVNRKQPLIAAGLSAISTLLVTAGLGLRRTGRGGRGAWHDMSRQSDDSASRGPNDLRDVDPVHLPPAAAVR